MQSDTHTPLADRHLLLAVDSTDASARAVLYVADFLGGLDGFRATVLEVIVEQPEDFFPTPTERAQWIEVHRRDADARVRKFAELLTQAGFPGAKVSTEVLVTHDRSVSECIRDAVERLCACTVVIGRREMSRKEEFLFGSTSSALVRDAHNCAVWVVE